MIIKKKDYEALVADLEYVMKRNRLLHDYLVEEYNLRCRLENDYKKLGVVYRYKSKESNKIFNSIYEINSEENEEESEE